MDSGDRSVISRVGMFARVPGELKYLVTCYQNAQRLPSFNMAVQRLLETHPALAELAARLYTNGKVTDGLDTDPHTETGDTRSDRGSAHVAGLFLGQLRSR
jgi:hypothetical protein